ncbi:MFS transporter [Mesorhizobium microcysteis]|uniref:MFS transporter n=1 Tax=Neoaquamicrobium microcysteis TaxID=2682781 RepID=A0A5D4GXZ4_9HYPH|nr:MFS transporter [Mesorhizobium microcysteis]TYR33731.1 MFS transporter [Mesorhizobium microcysteis]
MTLPPLTPDQMVKPRRFELRISLMFAALFLPVGIHLPYFPLWLEHVGFGAREIGVILAAPLFLRVVTTPVVTAFADRARDRANVLVAFVAASLLLSLGYFLPPTYTIVLGVSLVLAVFWTPHAPLTDSLALSGVRRFGSDYSRMRIWGSSSFLVANLAGGLILAATGPGAVPTIMAVGLATTLAVALLAPRLGRPRRASPLSAAELQQAAPSLLTPTFLYLVAGAGVINASHGLLYGFGSIYWKGLGIGETTIGMLWAWAVVAEVVMFAFFTRFFGHVSPLRLLIFAGFASMVRWAAFPLFWQAGLGTTGFFLAQSLHAVSTGLVLLGVQKMIAETVSEDRTGAAQGAAFFANGFAMASVMLASGPLYEMLGASGFYVMSGVAGMGVVLLLLARRAAAT